MDKPDLKFIHQYVPATAPDMDVMLLLLHGTGGNEDDLIPLGKQLLPGAAMLSPRGRVLEHGMPRFFRRFAEGVFDVEDLKLQTHDLDRFVRAAAKEYGIEKNRIVAVGYSNGANIAASLMFLHPDLLSGAVLFRAMVPFTPDSAPDLGGVKILLGEGRADPIVPRQDTIVLPELFTKSGAEVEFYWHEGGHELGQDDLMAAKDWLSKNF
jgi:predicted esterase